MIAVSLCLLPLLALTIALFNALTWRRGDAGVRAKGSISVLIPARNEEATIRRCVQSVLSAKGSESILEVLVYDDHSTDATYQIAHDMALAMPQVRVLQGIPLPAGWIGKPHACSQLARAARGDVLLFMDADVTLKPQGIERLVSLLGRPACGRVVTAVPEQITGSFFERLVIPLLLITYLAWLPLRLVERGRSSRTVAANGQLLLLTRQDYWALGGFESVRDQIVDDVAFCRHAKMRGLRVVFADGFLMASCRMYEGAKQTVDGFAKNLYEGVGGGGKLAVACLLYVMTFLAPFVALALALSVEGLQEPLLAPALLGVGANLSIRALLALRYGQPWDGLMLHPASIFAFVYIALSSLSWQRSGNVRWAGRTYPPLSHRTREAVSDARLNTGASGTYPNSVLPPLRDTKRSAT